MPSIADTVRRHVEELRRIEARTLDALLLEAWVTTADDRLDTLFIVDQEGSRQRGVACAI